MSRKSLCRQPFELSAQGDADSVLSSTPYLQFLNSQSVIKPVASATQSARNALTGFALFSEGGENSTREWRQK